MIDLRYRNGKIYTVRSHLTDLVYVGSTRTTLPKRIGKHKSNYKVYRNGKGKKVTVYDLFDLDPNCYIELHEYYPCNNIDELKKREGQVIRELDCVNRCIAGRTKQEYNQEYYQDNRQVINAKYNCQCGGKYTHIHRVSHFRTKKHRQWVLNQHQIFNHL